MRRDQDVRHRPQRVRGVERLAVRGRELGLYPSSQSRAEEQQALRRVATAVARQHEAEEVFDLVTREVARHLDADAAMLAVSSMLLEQAPPIDVAAMIAPQSVSPPRVSTATRRAWPSSYRGRDRRSIMARRRWWARSAAA